MNRDKEEHLKPDPWGLCSLQVRKVEGTSVTAYVTEAGEIAENLERAAPYRGNAEYISKRKMW